MKLKSHHKNNVVVTENQRKYSENALNSIKFIFI